MKVVVVVAVLGLGLVAAQRNGSCRDSGCAGKSPDGGCWCDSLCSTQSPSDCCSDYAAECGRGTRGSCRSSGCEGPSTDGDCWCDDECSIQEPPDCCSDRQETCGRARSPTSTLDGGVCQGCPAGPQTYDGGRQQCYCDPACQGLRDCCPSYDDYCAASLAPSARALYCQQLSTNQALFCGMSLKQAFYMPLDHKVSDSFDRDDSEFTCDAYPDGTCDVMDCSDDSDAWKTNLFKSVQDTCVNDPEITGDIETCYDRGDDTFVRFACSGNQIFQQYCRNDNDCDDDTCGDYPWIRVYHGGTMDAEENDGSASDAYDMDYQDEAPSRDLRPFGYPVQGFTVAVGESGYDVDYDNPVLPATSGICHLQINRNPGCDDEGDAGSDWFITVGAFGCLDQEVDSPDVWIWESFGRRNNPENDDKDRTDYDTYFADSWGNVWGDPYKFYPSAEHRIGIAASYEYFYFNENGYYFSGSFFRGPTHYAFTFVQQDLDTYEFRDLWAQWRVQTDAIALAARQSFDQGFLPWMGEDWCNEGLGGCAEYPSACPSNDYTCCCDYCGDSTECCPLPPSD